MGNPIIIAIPEEAVETIGGGGTDDFTFKGKYEVVMEEFRQKDELPHNDDGPFAGYTSTDGEQVGIQLGQINPLEGQDSPGERKVFVDLTTRDADRTIETVDNERDTDYWQIQKSQRTMLNLGLALGTVEKNGTGLAVDSDFIGDLMDEDSGFKGIHLGAVLSTRKYATRDDKAEGKGVKSGRSHEVVKFFSL